MAQEPRLQFDYHRSVAPIMWVFFAIAVIELVVVHLLVALTWPLVGWTLTILSAIGIVWILLGIRSFRRLPHELVGDRLTVRFGNMKQVRLGLGQVDRVIGSWEDGAVQAKNAINLAGIAYPNRCIELVEPLEKGRSRVFVRLDDPEPFDRALSAAGVETP